MPSLSSVLKSLPVYGQKPGEVAPIRKEPKVPKVDKLRVAAKNYPCVLCQRAKRFTIPAHCNDMRVKGIGKKSPAYMLAYICTPCHDQIDGRAGKLTKAAKRAMWLEAYWLTVQIWFRDSLVVCA